MEERMKANEQKTIDTEHSGRTSSMLHTGKTE
jgi:hypothetical protein